jgi:hypothetical protein
LEENRETVRLFISGSECASEPVAAPDGGRAMPFRDIASHQRPPRVSLVVRLRLGYFGLRPRPFAWCRRRFDLRQKPFGLRPGRFGLRRRPFALRCARS